MKKKKVLSKTKYAIYLLVVHLICILFTISKIVIPYSDFDIYDYFAQGIIGIKKSLYRDFLIASSSSSYSSNAGTSG